MEGSGDGARGATATWIDRHRPLYDRATRHTFIIGIRDGTVEIAAFKRWLSQDYIFVREFVPFVASVLLKACKQSDDPSDMEVILGGVSSINDEISWFKEEAPKWDVHLLITAPQKANTKYCRFLQSLTAPEISYPIAISAFWAIETVYQQSFSFCSESGSKTPAELMETCQRWGSDGFAEYCHTLRRIADRCLGKASCDELKRAEEVFLTILSHEISFWDMSSGES